MTLRALFPFHCNNEVTSHPPFSLVRHLAGTDLRAELWVTSRGVRAHAPFVRVGLPEPLSVAVDALDRRRGPEGWKRRITENRYRRAFDEGDAAWVYRGCSRELVMHLRDRGHPVFLERVNTVDHTARLILMDAFARAGWPVEEPYTARPASEADLAHVLAADFVFSPSPAVTASLLAVNVPTAKILETSYGWEPARFADRRPALQAIDGTTVLFVGGIGLRKGAHLLLDAWSRAGIRGRLVLVGRMEPLIARHCAHHLARPDVIHRDYEPDMGPLYRSAEVFAFPTLEEGSPLVSYEAIAHGLPVITTPMGAGRIIRHEVEGLVLDAHDRDGLIRAIQRLAEDQPLRRQLGAAARERAADYTWDKVAERRYALIKSALSPDRSAAVSTPQSR